MRGYLPGRFSFNVKGGRCEACAGDGTIRIEMHFLPDIYVPCEVCHGARYNRDTLEVTFRGKTIADVLELSCEEALAFFAHQPPIARHLQTLVDVGSRATSASASRRPPCRAARPSGSSWPPSSAGARPGTPSTCSTSRPPVSTSTTCASCSTCSTDWSTRATRSSSSSTTSTWSRAPTGSSTSVPRAVTGAGRWWPRARPRRWRMAPGSYTGRGPGTAARDHPPGRTGTPSAEAGGRHRRTEGSVDQRDLDATVSGQEGCVEAGAGPALTGLGRLLRWWPACAPGPPGPSGRSPRPR